MHCQRAALNRAAFLGIPSTFGPDEVDVHSLNKDYKLFTYENFPYSTEVMNTLTLREVCKDDIMECFASANTFGRWSDQWEQYYLYFIEAKDMNCAENWIAVNCPDVSISRSLKG